MTLTESDFIDLTNKFSQHKDNFSYEGKKALFKYLEEYEEDTRDIIEFDYISLCCDYEEYDNIDEVLKEYKSYGTEKGLDINTLDNLKDNTEIIEFTKYDLENFKDREYKSYIIREF
tara:strand:+ start:851 stop:1201 length:351 start_codon:yes stop_codon:yes gene_type:complete